MLNLFQNCLFYLCKLKTWIVCVTYREYKHRANQTIFVVNHAEIDEFTQKCCKNKIHLSHIQLTEWNRFSISVFCDKDELRKCSRCKTWTFYMSTYIYSKVWTWTSGCWRLFSSLSDVAIQAKRKEKSVYWRRWRGKKRTRSKKISLILTHRKHVGFDSCADEQEVWYGHQILYEPRHADTVDPSIKKTWPTISVSLVRICLCVWERNFECLLEKRWLKQWEWHIYEAQMWFI